MNVQSHIVTFTQQSELGTSLSNWLYLFYDSVSIVPVFTDSSARRRGQLLFSCEELATFCINQ